MLPLPPLSPKSLSVQPLAVAAVEVLVKPPIMLDAKVHVTTHVEPDAKTLVKPPIMLDVKVPVKPLVELDAKMPTMPNALLREDVVEADAETQLSLPVLRLQKCQREALALNSQKCQKEVLALSSLKPAHAKPPSKS